GIGGCGRHSPTTARAGNGEDLESALLNRAVATVRRPSIDSTTGLAQRNKLLRIRQGGTTREFCRSDPRTPVVRVSDQVVLGGVPEGAIVHGINAHGAVIAPAVGCALLRTCSRNDRNLVFQRAERIGGRASSEEDGRVHSGTG